MQLQPHMHTHALYICYTKCSWVNFESALILSSLTPDVCSNFSSETNKTSASMHSSINSFCVELSTFSRDLGTCRIGMLLKHQWQICIKIMINLVRFCLSCQFHVPCGACTLVYPEGLNTCFSVCSAMCEARKPSTLKRAGTFISLHHPSVTSTVTYAGFPVHSICTLSGARMNLSPLTCAQFL